MLGILGFALELLNLFLLFRVLLGYEFEENRAALAAAALLAVIYCGAFLLLSNDMLLEVYWLWEVIPVAMAVLCFRGRKLVVLGIGLCMNVVFLLMEFLSRGVLLTMVRGKIEKLDHIPSYPIGLAILVLVMLLLCLALRSKRIYLHGAAEQINPWAFFPFLLCKPIVEYDAHYSSSDIPDTMAQMTFASDLIRDSVIGLIFLMFFLVCLILVNQRRELRRMVMFNERCIREQAEQYQLQGKTELELRKFRHDHRAHFAVIRKLAEEDRAGRVLGYLDEIDVIGESLRFVSTNNMIGDAILNQYERMCREAGICLTVDGKFPEHMAASETGLCIVLSNGMKNAYDAALKCEEKRFIEVAINNDGEHYVFLIIRNSCCRPLKLQDGIPVTVKDDKKNHGLGTRNMMEAATKFGGSVVWRTEEGIVITEIMIPA